MRSWIVALCLSTLAVPVTAESETPSGPGRPPIEKLDDGRIKFGEILLDPADRSIRFPAEVNQTEGLLEFILVHVDGKTHESLLATRVSPTHLNLAFKLLDYQASPELYYRIHEDGSLTNELHEATPEQKRSARIQVYVQTGEPPRRRTHLAAELIRHAVTEKPMTQEPWVYGGSFFDRGVFAAERSGDLIAIFLRNSALINFSGKDRDLDDVWLPRPDQVPEVGTPVTVILRPIRS